jgi:hypothetical protein
VKADKAFSDAMLKSAPAIVWDNFQAVRNVLHIGSLIFAYVEKQLDEFNARRLCR